jgi:hypothetical protein
MSKKAIKKEKKMKKKEQQYKQKVLALRNQLQDKIDRIVKGELDENGKPLELTDHEQYQVNLLMQAGKKTTEQQLAEQKLTEVVGGGWDAIKEQGVKSAEKFVDNLEQKYANQSEANKILFMHRDIEMEVAELKRRLKASTDEHIKEFDKNSDFSWGPISEVQHVSRQGLLRTQGLLSSEGVPSDTPAKASFGDTDGYLN